MRIDEILAHAHKLKVDTEATEFDWLAEDYEEDKGEIDGYFKGGIPLPSI